MSISANAGRSVLYLYNHTRENANPPVVFSDCTPTSHFSYCFWVRLANNIPVQLTAHRGTDGSVVFIASDGINLYLQSRIGSVAEPAQAIISVSNVINRWVLIVVTKDGLDFRVYWGIEDNTVPNYHTIPIQLIHQFTVSSNLNFTFDHFALVCNVNTSMCCFKWWNNTLTQAEAQIQCQRWDAENGGLGPVPIWASPLRTAGDVSNIANPYASPDWNHGHAYTTISDQGNLITLGSSLGNISDPAYMGHNFPCPAWVYPSTPDPLMSVDPGLTPLVSTIYKAGGFFRFKDVGSVPHVDFQIHSIKYYGYPYAGTDPGTPASDTWGLYKDENGVEVSDTSGPQFKFEPTTGVTIPGGILSSTMYLWRFGAQFTYPPATPQGPTKEANLRYTLLYVTFTGWPTGVPFVSEVDLSGLFAINSKVDYRLDIYNNIVELKIPNPTIRTAYIGE